MVDGIPGWTGGIPVGLLAEGENGLVDEEPLPTPCYVCGKIPKLMSLNEDMVWTMGCNNGECRGRPCTPRTYKEPRFAVMAWNKQMVKHK